jgi:hypothetical protein
MKSAFSLVVVVAVIAIVPVAESALSPALAGKWTRTVSRADVRRAQGASTLIGSVCALTIKTSGKASVLCTKVGGFPGTIAPAGTNRVEINLGLPGANSYRWHISGQSLTFKLIKDPIPDRVAVFDGTWKRSQK